MSNTATAFIISLLGGALLSVISVELGIICGIVGFFLLKSKLNDGD